jgi:hypothetical protein
MSALRRQLIRPVENPSTTEIARDAVPTPAQKATGTDFATLHAAAVAGVPAASSTGGTAATEKPAATAVTPGNEPWRKYPRIPEGETWASVKPGAHYARIITGPRAGQYINLSHDTDRRNQTFTIEQRGGKTVHVYGSGTSEVVVDESADRADVKAAGKPVKDHSDQPRPGEVWEPVRGHRYADIIGGPRNGLFVNTTGGPRDGMTFQIVRSGGKVLHVYGTGKNREVIQVDPHPAAPAVTTNGGTPAAGTHRAAAGVTGAATGGVAPPATATGAAARIAAPATGGLTTPATAADTASSAASLHTWPVPAFSMDSAALLATSVALPAPADDGDSSEARRTSRPASGPPAPGP